MRFRMIRARLAAALVAAALAATAGIGLAPAALAHSGPMELQLNQDGAGHIQVSATYVEDGHPVTGVINPEMTAVASDGSLVGPVAMMSAPEGEGIWIADDTPLAAGDWTVTVTVTDPVEASVVSDLTVVMASTTPLAPVTQQTEGAPVPAVLIAAGIAALVAIGLTIAILIIRRTRTVSAR